MDSGCLVIRADAGTRMGTGHVMRCLALAEAWCEGGGRVVFATATPLAALEARLQAAGARVSYVSDKPGSNDDVLATAALAHEVHASWVVIDGYHFDAVYQKRIKDASLRLLVVDDYGQAEHYCADVILNPHSYARSSLYSYRRLDTRLLLGPRYLLLRREFLQEQVRACETPFIACRLLITLGGSDPENVTDMILRALEDVAYDNLETLVIVGANNPHHGHLMTRIQASRRPPRITHNVTNLAMLMRWADFAISAAGTTAWELAFMGVPTLLIAVAENQRAIAEALDTAGAAINLDWHATLHTSAITRAVNSLIVSSEQRRRMSERGRALVDGYGAARVVATLRDDGLRLRAVQAEDCHLLWAWANDPSVRAMSFTTGEILWETHRHWFQRRMQDSHCVFYIAIDCDDTPVGQVRYECNHDQAVVSISVARHGRGKGYGTTLLRLSAHRLFATTTVTTVHAYIRSDNVASIRAFTKAGYAKAVEPRTRLGAVHLILQRPTYPCPDIQEVIC